MPTAPPIHRPHPRKSQRARARDESQFASRRAPRRKLYNTEAWRRLRDYIRMRDGWICQLCGEAAGPGNNAVDHITPAVEADDVVCDEANLRLLCARCHNGRRYGAAG